MSPRPKNPTARTLKVYTRDQAGVMKAVPGLIAIEIRNEIVKVYRLTPGNFSPGDSQGIQEILFDDKYRRA